MPGRGVPVDVVTDGVTVMVDVPCGVPITCGVGTTCGLALAPPPAHPAASKTESDARTASAATRSKAALELQRCNLEAKRSSTKAPQPTSKENACNQINGGSCGGCGGGMIMVFAVVPTVTT